MARSAAAITREICALSDRDLRAALTLGFLNFDSLKPEARADLQKRLSIMTAEAKRRGWLNRESEATS